MSNAQRIISSARSTCLTSFDKYLVERCKSRPGLSQRPHKKVSCTTSSAGTSIDIFPRWPRKVGIKIQDMSIGPLYTPQGNPLTAPPPCFCAAKARAWALKVAFPALVYSRMGSSQFPMFTLFSAGKPIWKGVDG